MNEIDLTRQRFLIEVISQARQAGEGEVQERLQEIALLEAVRADMSARMKRGRHPRPQRRLNATALRRLLRPANVESQPEESKPPEFGWPYTLENAVLISEQLRANFLEKFGLPVNEFSDSLRSTVLFLIAISDNLKDDEVFSSIREEYGKTLSTENVGAKLIPHFPRVAKDEPLSAYLHRVEKEVSKYYEDQSEDDRLSMFDLREIQMTISNLRGTSLEQVAADYDVHVSTVKRDVQKTLARLGMRRRRGRRKMLKKNAPV